MFSSVIINTRRNYVSSLYYKISFWFSFLFDSVTRQMSKLLAKHGITKDLSVNMRRCAQADAMAVLNRFENERQNGRGAQQNRRTSIAGTNVYQIGNRIQEYGFDFLPRIPRSNAVNVGANGSGSSGEIEANNRRAIQGTNNQDCDSHGVNVGASTSGYSGGNNHRNSPSPPPPSATPPIESLGSDNPESPIEFLYDSDVSEEEEGTSAMVDNDNGDFGECMQSLFEEPAIETARDELAEYFANDTLDFNTYSNEPASAMNPVDNDDDFGDCMQSLFIEPAIEMASSLVQPGVEHDEFIEWFLSTDPLGLDTYTDYEILDQNEPNETAHEPAIATVEPNESANDQAIAKTESTEDDEFGEFLQTLFREPDSSTGATVPGSSSGSSSQLHNNYNPFVRLPRSIPFSQSGRPRALSVDSYGVNRLAHRRGSVSCIAAPSLETITEEEDEFGSDVETLLE